MCGIFGAFDPSAPLPGWVRDWAEDATRLLAHRGPDEACATLRAEGRCLLGHTRLAIIDLAGGAQPIANEDGTVWVVHNGEIYNYIELRERLIDRGHRFRTNSDTEVLVHLYEEKGAALVDDLNGMHAFAIFDEKARRLLLTRDAFGEKPLYWTRLPGGGVAFASEMKALLALGRVDRSLDVAAVAQFLALRYVPAPRTHLSGIHKLEAAGALSIDDGSTVRQWRYWRPDFSEGSAPVPAWREAVEDVQARLHASVRLRLRSDVPVSALLSGGVDSTAVACAVRAAIGSAPFDTFCVGFEDASLDETPYARLVARHLETRHHEVRISSTDLLREVGSLIRHYDEPFADASLIPTFAVYRAVRETSKVVLTGDGGDEWFAGYRQHFERQRWNRLRRLSWVRRMAATIDWPQSWRGRDLLRFLGRSDWDLLHPVQRDETLSYFSSESRDEARAGLEELERRARVHARLPFPRSSMEAVASGYLPEQILVKVDRASMRVGLESRAPFLDRPLVELVTKLPQRYHYRRGLGKALLRAGLPAWVPPDIRWRGKQGFTPPLSHWLRSSLRPLLQQSLEEVPAEVQPMLDPTRARSLFRTHLSGSDCSDELFRWLVLMESCRAGQTSKACDGYRYQPSLR